MYSIAWQKCERIQEIVRGYIPKFPKEDNVKELYILTRICSRVYDGKIDREVQNLSRGEIQQEHESARESCSVVVKILILAQEYGFSQLETECINELVTVKFSNLRKVRPGYENISMDNRLLILERRASNLEEDLEQTKEDLEQSETREEDAVSRLKLVTSRANKCFVEFIKFVNLCGAQLSRSAFACNRDPTHPSLFARSLEDIRRYDHTRYGDVRIDVEPLERLHVLLQKMI